MDTLQLAVEIRRFVIENGRVDEAEGQAWLDSLEVEVEAEARMRGYENSDEIARIAVTLV